MFAAYVLTITDGQDMQKRHRAPACRGNFRRRNSAAAPAAGILARLGGLGPRQALFLLGADRDDPCVPAGVTAGGMTGPGPGQTE